MMFPYSMGPFRVSRIMMSVYTLNTDIPVTYTRAYPIKSCNPDWGSRAMVWCGARLDGSSGSGSLPAPLIICCYCCWYYSYALSSTLNHHIMQVISLSRTKLNLSRVAIDSYYLFKVYTQG